MPALGQSVTTVRDSLTSQMWLNSHMFLYKLDNEPVSKNRAEREKKMDEKYKITRMETCLGEDGARSSRNLTTGTE